MRLTGYFVFKVLVLVGLGSNLATSADVFVHTLDFLKPINDPVSPAKSIFSTFWSFSDCSNYVQNKNGRLLRKRMTGIEPTTSSGNRASWQTATHWSGGKSIPMCPRKKHDYSNRTHDLADHQPLIIAIGLKTTTRLVPAISLSGSFRSETRFGIEGQNTRPRPKLMIGSPSLRWRGNWHSRASCTPLPCAPSQLRVYVWVWVCPCVCECERMRERERDWKREGFHFVDGFSGTEMEPKGSFRDKKERKKEKATTTFAQRQWKWKITFKRANSETRKRKV